MTDSGEEFGFSGNEELVVDGGDLGKGEDGGDDAKVVRVNVDGPAAEGTDEGWVNAGFDVGIHAVDEAFPVRERDLLGARDDLSGVVHGGLSGRKLGETDFDFVEDGEEEWGRVEGVELGDFGVSEEEIEG